MAVIPTIFANLSNIYVRSLLYKAMGKKHALINCKAQRGPKLARLPMDPVIGPNVAS